MTRFEIRTKQLRAIAACAARADEIARIAGVAFRPGEIVATDGHNLLRLPAKHDLSVIVPVALIDAACAGQLTNTDGQVDEFGYAVDDQNSVFIDVDGEHVTIDVGDVELRAKALSAEDFPSMKKLNETAAKSSGNGNPMGVCFDPSRLQKFYDVLAGGADSGAVWLSSCGRALDPLVFSAASGATFTLMPMARSAEERAA
jgi:hypothetical protein